MFNKLLLKVYLLKIFVQVVLSLLNNKAVDWNAVIQSNEERFHRVCMLSVSLWSCMFWGLFFSRKLGGMSNMEAARELNLQHMVL